MRTTTRRIGLFVAALGLMACSVGSARAESVMYLFTASSYNDDTTLSGRFSYVASQGPSWVPPVGTYAEFTAGTGWGIEVETGGQSLTILPDYSRVFYEVIIVDNEPGVGRNDTFNKIIKTIEGIELYMGFSSSDASVFETHLRMPEMLDLDKFDVHRGISVYGAGFSFSGRIDSLVFDPAGSAADLDPAMPVIPEPSTLASTLIGGALVGGWWLKRRRKVT